VQNEEWILVDHIGEDQARLHADPDSSDAYPADMARSSPEAPREDGDGTRDSDAPFGECAQRCGPPKEITEVFIPSSG
jgi:hypothetical protein